ncbi:MAG: hypothetical protein AB7O52_06030 [Planctomycetota bacterium]
MNAETFGEGRYQYQYQYPYSYSYSAKRYSYSYSIGREPEVKLDHERLDGYPASWDFAVFGPTSGA